jgi:hypothetical protein
MVMNQWRSQEISGGMSVTIEKRSSTPIRDNIIPFYNVFAGKKWKKNSPGGGGRRIAFHWYRHCNEHQVNYNKNGIRVRTMHSFIQSSYTINFTVILENH